MATAVPVAPRRLHPALSALREALLAVSVGVGIGVVVAINQEHPHWTHTMVLCGIAGLTIFSTAQLLGHGMDRWTCRLGRRGLLAARGVQFAVSGGVAWWVRTIVGEHWLGVGFGSDWPRYLLLTGGLAVAIGFTFYGFGVIRSRLEQSVARLKEIEFAEKELQMARELQSRLLPPPEIAGDGYRIAARNLPAHLVAGDFYDSFLLPDGAVGVVVGDVAGKGMAAALVMASVKAMLPLVAAERSAAETLRELNRRLAAELRGREFVALAFARLDAGSGAVELANAGLPDPYLLVRGQAPVAQIVPGPRLPLGVRREIEYRSLTLRLAAGDRLLLLTDGLAEAPVAAAGEPLGYAALGALVGAAPTAAGGGGGAPLAWIDALIERVRQATQPVLEDDWTALLLEWDGQTGAATAADVADVAAAGIR
jgi:Stage II sporulation protein E (SpoIIE)